MSDYIQVSPELVIDTEGEIVSAAGIDDAMKFVAIKRHEAKAQQKEWEAHVADLDRVLLRNQKEKKVAYGDTVIAVCGGTYAKTNAEQFAQLLFDQPLELEDLFAVIAAASGFKKDLLPEAARKAYFDTTTTHEKRSWIESSVARKRAPQREQPEGRAMEQFNETVEMLREERGLA